MDITPKYNRNRTGAGDLFRSMAHYDIPSSEDTGRIAEYPFHQDVLGSYV